MRCRILIYRPIPTSSRRGFTLIESICTICVLGVIGVISSRLVVEAGDQYLSASVQAQLSNDVSAAMERLVGQIRQIPIRPSSSPPVPDITGMTTTSIAWNDSSGVACAVALQGTQLIWTEGVTSVPLLNNVATFALSSMNEDAAALPPTLSGAATDAVRRITITIGVQKAGVSETLRTTLFVRASITGAAAP